jgi:hypothetical protein
MSTGTANAGNSGSVDIASGSYSSGLGGDVAITVGSDTAGIPVPILPASFCLLCLEIVNGIMDYCGGETPKQLLRQEE